MIFSKNILTIIISIFNLDQAIIVLDALAAEPHHPLSPVVTAEIRLISFVIQAFPVVIAVRVSTFGNAVAVVKTPSIAKLFWSKVQGLDVRQCLHWWFFVE